MKYVLYDGKAYETIIGTSGLGQYKLLGFDGFPLRNVDGDRGEVWKSDCTEISEAEFYARKLLECSVLFDDGDISGFIEQCEKEREPKPEITERHIGCIVEQQAGGVYCPVLLVDAKVEGLRLSQQAVPLAFHSYDGLGQPSWVDDKDMVIVRTDVQWSLEKAGSFTWNKHLGGAVFAVIKPVLPE